MNIYILICLIATMSCSTTNKIKVTNKMLNDFEVIGWYDDSTDKIWAISFPFQIHIKNYKKNDWLINYKYEYKEPSEGKYANLYFVNKNKVMSKIEPFKKNKLTVNEKYKLLLYSKHIILNTDYSNKILSKINENIKDSILLGTISNFKDLYPSLASDLIEGDTLVLRFKSSENNKKKRIKVPIKL
ncbi:hypothetical protein [Tenacibaculum ovolyticum]|uniref:hypothetical protein n=1 Tax=Tenacibaculum ovolyticum TaxID=104270 RepID=UPI003BABEAE9